MHLEDEQDESIVSYFYKKEVALFFTIFSSDWEPYFTSWQASMIGLFYQNSSTFSLKYSIMDVWEDPEYVTVTLSLYDIQSADFLVLHFSILTEVNTNLYTRLRHINIFNALLIGVQYMLSFQWTNFGLKYLTEVNTNLFTSLRLISTHPHTASRKTQKRNTCYLAPVFSILNSQVNIRLLVKKSIININLDKSSWQWRLQKK